MVEPNFENRTLYHGDNLDFLRGINSATVNLIATDPPFNKARDFHATPDSLAKGASFQDRWSWRDDIHDEWLVAIQRDEPDVWQVINAAKTVYGDDMGAFLCWLGVRLLEMHRILRDDGSLYLHIDHTAHAYVKCLLDAIFGKANFRREIIWAFERPSGFKSVAPNWVRRHDTILYYVKNVKRMMLFNKQYEPYPASYKANFNQIDDEGRYWLRDGKKRRMGEGFAVGDVFTDINSMQTQAVSRKESTGYPTQKPLALYERIIKASSNPGDIVLDPATTPVAAERLGRQWVGMDLWDGAYQIVLNRLESEGLAVPEAADISGQQTLTFNHITYATTPPKRTDQGEEAVLRLQTPTAGQEKGHPPTRSQHGRLLIDIGPFCQGDGRDFTFDPRILEVDHIRPKSDGGSDAYDNLTLLCPPCNKEKRDRMTLTGLQALNRKEGRLTPANERNIRHGGVPKKVAGKNQGRRR